ncbi:MAG: sulfatase-like hydrolase/transferase [Deltaproteobacteria bacterium]|nr:sulfatase-like hydrolase/transferase [Deltaproteobacteria bacterium]
MSPSPARVLTAWILVAHTLGASAIGALDAARLGSASLAMVLVPLFAVTGLVAGFVIAGTERIAAGRAWWVSALIRGAPSLLVLVPVASTLFDGAFAQTLPLAFALPYVVPILGWLSVSLAIAGGSRFLRAGDPTTRAIMVLACAGALGAIVWGERNLLGTGYPGAHVGATLAVLVLAGVCVRALGRFQLSPYLAAGLAAAAIGTAIATAMHGLEDANQRRVLATYGDQGRDLVRLWRQLIDRDRDGSSPVLGGGDCDDGDASRHPGAADSPDDGIDQDCDGRDALPPPPPAAKPKAIDLASWRESSPVAETIARTKGMNVLLLTIDALRFDMLAPEAADRAEFPELTKLLDESVFFTRAFSPASGTDISLGTLLTGRHDPHQTIETTLPEALQSLGFRTYSALPVEVTRYVGEVLPGRGMDRPRPVYTDWDTTDVADHVSGPATTLEGVRAWNDAADRRSFIWLHYFDVHEHHQIPVPKRLLKKVREEASDRRRRYRALLFAIDTEIGRLRAELVQRGLADKTIIIFASDHGESLREDPRLLETHGKVVYAPLVRIPLAFHIPGVRGGLRTDPASLVDIAPTLLSLLDSRSSLSPMDGVDLLPALLDAPEALRAMKRALVINEELQWSVVEWPYQLLVRPAENLAELYDLSTDPQQKTDLVSSMPEVVARLRARYAEAPVVRVDRTIDGRRWREQQARRPQRRAPP